MADHNAELAKKLAGLQIAGNVRIGGKALQVPPVAVRAGAPQPGQPQQPQPLFVPAPQLQPGQVPPTHAFPPQQPPMAAPVLAVPHQPFMSFPGTGAVMNAAQGRPRQPPTYGVQHLQIGVPAQPPLNLGGFAPPVYQLQQQQAPQGQRQQQDQPRRDEQRGRGRGRGGAGRGGYNASQSSAAAPPVPPPTAPTAATATVVASHPASIEPMLPPPPKPEVDQDLVKQMLERYSEQHEKSDSGILKPPGLLEVDAALKTIDEHDVTFIVTDTGTGKSTLLPKTLMERGFKVVSSQPRRTATINLALRVAHLRNEPLGNNVGYLVRGDHIGDEKTRLMYMTSYTLFLWIVSHPEDLGYSHFIIDEFHERQPDVEVMLALLKLARLKTKQQFKIILMSASAEVQEWSSYFDGLSVGIYSTCKPRYPVYEYYQEEVCRLVGAAFNPSPVTPVVGSLTLKNALFLVERMLEMLAKHADPSHSILVFLPGRTVVEQMSKWIQTKLGNQLDPVPWYRDVELERIDAAFKRTNDTRKKVYLATDIAEVSITLPDVVFVIDSGTTKKPRIDPAVRNSVVFPPLELLWTSKSSVAQRKGRIGRVQQGFYFSMLPETHLPLLVDMEPQIANSRIDELSLHILQIAANPLAVFNLCRQNTKKECVQLSTNILVDNGCALPMNHEHAPLEAVEHPDCAPWRQFVMNDPANAELRGAAFVTTVRGKIAQRLPLAVSGSLAVVNGLLLGLDSMGIVTAAIIASGTPFYAVTDDDRNPEAKRKQVVEVSDTMAEYAKAAPSDILASVIATLEFKCMAAMGHSETFEENWCEARHLSRIRLQNIVKLEAQIKEQLAAVTSFVDIQDVATLLAAVQASPRLVTWLAASAFFERAIYIEFDAAEAQRKKKAGRSLFLGFDALCDYQVPSCVSWQKGTIVIPTILQARYDKLFGAFAVRFTPTEFNVLLLLLNYAAYFDNVERRDAPPPGMPPQLVATWNPAPYVVFGVELHQRKMTFRVAVKLAQQILSFREALGVRTRLQRIMVTQNLSMDMGPEIAQAAKEKGLPAIQPAELGVKLSAMLTSIMDSVSGAAPENVQSCIPYFGPFTPTKVSMILSSGPTMSAFIPPVTLDDPDLPPTQRDGAPTDAA